MLCIVITRFCGDDKAWGLLLQAAGLFCCLLAFGSCLTFSDVHVVSRKWMHTLS